MLTRVEFQPGIVSDDSALSKANGFIDGDKVRVRNGRMETIGGWEFATLDQFENPARGAHAWASLEGDRIFSFGTSTKLYGYFGGDLIDITPLKAKGTLTNPFATVNGSDLVTVTHQDHGLRLGDLITYALADAVGGITINGEYELISVPTLDTYVIQHTSNASSAATGGGKVEYEATLDAGLVDGTGGGRGYGTGAYGTGFYGLSTITEFDPRVWSLDNWGGNLLATPRNGALYEWQPLGSYSELISNGDFASSDDWSAGTGWAIGSGVATATAGVASDLTQDVTGIIAGGVTYVVSFTVTRTAGSLQLQVESADIATGKVDQGEPIAKAGTYTRYFTAPSRPINLIFAKDDAFAGTVDNVSITVVPIAYRLQSAPQYAVGMFVDPARIVVMYGTIEADGDFNPMLVRWSGQENNRIWIPDVDNLAGEFVLARGSRIIGGFAGRGENLIWTDAALYSMRFTGDVGDVFRFDLVGENCGLIGKNAAAIAGGRVFWWARNNQFYTYRGGEPEIVECPIRREAVDNFAPAQEEKIYACVNAEFSEIWWFYPDARDGNECSRYICFNLRRRDVDARHSRLALRGCLRASTRTRWDSGLDNRLYFHERGRTANGATIDWSLKTGIFDINDGDTLMAVKRYIPDFADQIGNVNIDLRFSQWQRGALVDAGSYSIAPSTPIIPLRHMGRQAQITWRAGANSRFARFGAQRFDVDKTGARR
jgi:hypothetical protein